MRWQNHEEAAIHSTLVAKNRKVYRGERHGGADADGDQNIPRQRVAAVVIDLFHVRITNAGGRVGLSIADHEVFIAGAVNITLYFRAIVERDRRAGF